MAEDNIASEKNWMTHQVEISDVIFITLKRWPWLLLSVAVCVGLGLFYVLRAQPVFTRTATIAVKDDSNGNSMSAGLDAFSDMGLIKSRTNINDEITKLQSPDIMAEVVRRFNLDKSYYIDGRFHKEIIYGPQLPVSVSFPSLMDNESASLTVELFKDGKYSLHNVTCNGDDASIITKDPVLLGDTVKTSAGPVVVSKTPYYTGGSVNTIYVSKAPLKGVVATYLGKLTVAHKNDKGNTINLTVSDGSIQRAEDILEGVISVYNEKWIEDRNQVAISTSNFINERLAVIEAELGDVDQDISSYQSEHLIPDVQQAASMYMAENQEASAQIFELNNQLQLSRYMRAYLNDEAKKNQVIPANTGIENANIEAQIGEYNSKMLLRNQYASNSSETHPLVTDLDMQLATMRSAILSAIDNQILALDTRIRNIQGNKRQTTAQIAASPSQAKYLLSVGRQQKVKEALYLFLLQKREENELSQAFTAYNTQVIAKPNGSNAPTSPVRNRILLIAFAFGLVLPFGVTYLLETINTRVRGRKDIESLSIPFLGEIPEYKSRKGESMESRVVVKQGKRNVINEAFRVLRTNIGFVSSKDSGGSAIMVTSFNPGSGKTFLTVNLAISLAIKGKKVVVVDGDLRRGSASAYVGSPKKGLSNYLVGEVQDIKDIEVNDTLMQGLAVIPIGIVPPNPTELLESRRFADLISRLKSEYDLVFVDCPPVEMMADAQIIEQLVDRTVFVIRAGLFKRVMLPELEKLYQEKKFKNIGIVLNATAAEGSRYGYKYGYGYGYGYGNYSHYTSK